MVRMMSLILVLAGALGGCVFADAVVTVPYKPSDAPRIAGAGAVTLAVTDGRIIDRDRISTKIDGYGLNRGAVRSSTNVPDIVRAALEAELKQRGFKVGAGGRILNATVNRFYSDYNHGVVSGGETGDVELVVDIADASGAKLFSGTYKGTYESAVIIVNGSNAAESVGAALSDAIGKMFSDSEFRRILVAG